MLIKVEKETYDISCHEALTPQKLRELADMLEKNYGENAYFELDLEEGGFYQELMVLRCYIHFEREETENEKRVRLKREAKRKKDEKKISKQRKIKYRKNKIQELAKKLSRGFDEKPIIEKINQYNKELDELLCEDDKSQ